MIRVVAVHLLLFVLPFLAYGLWLVIRRRPVTEAEGWAEAPFAWLALAGAALVIAGFLTLASFGRSDRDGTYVPSSYIDGKFVPGHIE